MIDVFNWRAAGMVVEMFDKCKKYRKLRKVTIGLYEFDTLILSWCVSSFTLTPELMVAMMVGFLLCTPPGSLYIFNYTTLHLHSAKVPINYHVGG